jgi:hypothetical protein
VGRAGWRAVRRIRRTVAALRWRPSRESSPRTLRYPQDGFSRPSRRTRSRISLLVGRRPGWLGYVHLRWMRRAVTGEQRAWRDQAMAAQPGGQQPGQCGQDHPVGPVEPGPGDLAGQELRVRGGGPGLGVLRRLAAGVSSCNQPKTRMMVTYRSRIGTVRDLASSRSAGQTAGHSLCTEFWSSTRLSSLGDQR